MRARIGVSAAVLAATILVAACSGDEDEPSSLPDATTAGSAVTPTDTGSTPPADPTAHLEAEITQFIFEYDKVVDESWTSEDALTQRREMFADSCVPCLRGYELTRKALADGLTLEAEFGTIRSVRLDAVNGGVATFLVMDDVPAARLVDASSEVVQEFDATIGAQIVYQARKNPAGQWVLISSEVLSVESGGAS
jgi:hypothetical protein